MSGFLSLKLLRVANGTHLVCDTGEMEWYKRALKRRRGLHLVPVIITSSTSKTDGVNDGMFMKCIISAV